jgi:hypothetical protein
MTRPLALGLACVALICSQIARADQDLSCDFGTDSNSGIVIFSGTLPNGTGNPGFPEDFSYGFNAPDGNLLTQHGFDLKKTDHTFYRGHAQTDFDDQFGRVYAIRLPEGHYDFTQWAYLGHRTLGWRSGVRVLPLPFSVQRGRATYLGSFEPVVWTGKSLFGNTMDAAYPAVADRHERDLEVFHHKCPRFDPALIDLGLLKLGPWGERPKS